MGPVAYADLAARVGRVAQGMPGPAWDAGDDVSYRRTIRLNGSRAWWSPQHAATVGGDRYPRTARREGPPIPVAETGR
jgi:hypothetical protein